MVDLVLTIRLSDGTRWTIRVPEQSVSTCRVLQIKEHLATLSDPEYVRDVPVERMRLIYQGRILDNSRLLSEYGITPETTLFLVKQGTATTTTTAPTSASPSTANNTTASPNSTYGNPWMTAGTAPSFSSSSSMGPFFPPTPPNPQQLEQMLNNPLLQGMLESQPDFLRNMLQAQAQANPQLQQLLDQNPALRHVFDDPAAWQQVVDMMRNPSAMQQALRNQDLALSQLENMPGGMAALSNMYSQFQQPLEESLWGATENTSTHPNSNSHTGAGAAGQAMPNPWGSSSNTTAGNSNTNNSNNNDNNNRSTMGIGMLPTNPWAAMGTSANATGAAPNNNPLASLLGGMSPPADIPGLPTPSPEQRERLLQMLDNPLMSNMMQNAVQQNPELFRNLIVQQNPMLAQLLGNDPAAMDRMIQQMMNPSTIRAMLQMEEQMRGMQVGGGGGGGTSSLHPTMGGVNSSSSSSSNNNNINNPWAVRSPGEGLDFASFFQGGHSNPMFPSVPLIPGMIGTTGSHNGSSTSVTPPAELYARQLQDLYSMGFDDELRNLEALQSARGNLNAAVDFLLSQPVVSDAGSNAPTAAAATTTTTSDSSSISNPILSSEEDRMTSTNSNHPTSPSSPPSSNTDDNSSSVAPPKSKSEKKND